MGRASRRLHPGALRRERPDETDLQHGPGATGPILPGGAPEASVRQDPSGLAAESAGQESRRARPRLLRLWGRNEGGPWRGDSPQAPSPWQPGHVLRPGRERSKYWSLLSIHRLSQQQQRRIRCPSEREELHAGEFREIRPMEQRQRTLCPQIPAFTAGRNRPLAREGQNRRRRPRSKEVPCFREAGGKPAQEWGWQRGRPREAAVGQQPMPQGQHLLRRSRQPRQGAAQGPGPGEEDADLLLRGRGRTPGPSQAVEPGPQAKPDLKPMGEGPRRPGSCSCLGATAPLEAPAPLQALPNVFGWEGALPPSQEGFPPPQGGQPWHRMSLAKIGRRASVSEESPCATAPEWR
ncbi:hypothetical protein JRQ81_009554 [Phrynocephalus forsythii]|uniref:Uncharacterized protein n=1 Tax=Phrynocephalus forsythii TaxID=171643 RepID=A0A9Q0X9Z5_9SAUR|nr:hypothetical protein JRQ81_009554 [Phrynocephalus forsythii]